jgi:hypothetical protein
MGFLPLKIIFPFWWGFFLATKNKELLAIFGGGRKK